MLKGRYILASLAAHGAVICAAATMARWSRRDMRPPVPRHIRFEIVEAAAPKKESLEQLEGVEGLEGLEGLEELEELESLEQLESSIAPLAPDERTAVEAAPVALNRITPAYPRSARRKGHEGSVTVEFSINGDGGVSGVVVAGSSGHAELDASALAAVREARFAPKTAGGAGERFRLTLDFRLK